MTTAELVKILRARTDVSVALCLEALKSSNNDLDKAVEWLNQHSTTLNEQHSSKEANESALAVLNQGKKIAIIEVSTQTDFVLRNEKFSAFCAVTLASMIRNETYTLAEMEASPLDSHDLDTLKMNGINKVQEALHMLVSQIGEKIVIKRAIGWGTEKGFIFSYVHMPLQQDIGKIAAAVEIESDIPYEDLQGFGRRLALHLTAFHPLYLYAHDIPSDELEAKRQEAYTTAQKEGKPAAIAAKIAEGLIRKYEEQVVFLKQRYIRDDKTTIEELLSSTCKELGGTFIKIIKFIRWPEE